MSEQRRHLGEVPGWHLFGRPVRPFHAALALASGCLAALEILAVTPLGRSAWGVLLEVAAIGSAVLLTWGWWARNDKAAEWGLSLVAAVWAARSTLVLLTGTSTFGTVWLTAGLSLAWVVGAAGAWVLERADHDWGRPGNGADGVDGE